MTRTKITLSSSLTTIKALLIMMMIKDKVISGLSLKGITAGKQVVMAMACLRLKISSLPSIKRQMLFCELLHTYKFLLIFLYYL